MFYGMTYYFVAYSYGRKNGWKTYEKVTNHAVDDLYEKNSYKVLKRTAEDRSALRGEKALRKCQTPAVQRRDYANFARTLHKTGVVSRHLSK